MYLLTLKLFNIMGILFRNFAMKKNFKESKEIIEFKYELYIYFFN